MIVRLRVGATFRYQAYAAIVIGNMVEARGVRIFKPI
jgi:hypothetical protein